MLNFPRIMDWTNNVFALFSVVVVAATQTSIIRKNYRFSSKSSNGSSRKALVLKVWVTEKIYGLNKFKGLLQSTKYMPYETKIF